MRFLSAAAALAATLIAASPLLAADDAKPGDAKEAKAEVKTVVVIGKVSVSKSGKEVTLISDRDGMLFIPEKVWPLFKKYDGKNVKVSCIAPADPKAKPVPDKVVEVMDSGKKSK